MMASEAACTGVLEYSEYTLVPHFNRRDTKIQWRLTSRTCMSHINITTIGSVASARLGVWAIENEYGVL